METGVAGPDRTWVGWGPVAMVTAILVVRLPSLSEPPWASDDGYFTAAAVLTSKGIALYAGVFDVNPPGIYWLYRLLVALGAVQHHVLVQLVATLAVVAASLLSYGVVARVSPRSTALLTGWLTGLVLSIPALDGDLLNVEVLALPMFLGALLLAFQRRRASLLGAGLLLALAIATRPSFLLDSLALAVPLLGGDGRVRRVATVAAGLLAGLAAVTTGLWFEGSLNAYLMVAMPADHAYVVWANQGTLLPLYLRLAILALVGGAVFRRSRSSAGRLATVWLIASIAGSSITPRELSHFSHEAIPAIAFAVALVAARQQPRAVAYPLAAVAVALVAELVLLLPGVQTALESGHRPRAVPPYFTYADLPAYYGNWLAYAVGARDWERYSGWFPGGARTDAAEARWLATGAGGEPLRLVVLGDRPWLFVDSGALPATRFIATNSAFWQVRGEPAEVAGLLRAGCAGVVVYEPGAGDWQADLQAGGYQPQPGAPWPTYLPDRPAACP